jgi:hypothetical protein
MAIATDGTTTAPSIDVNGTAYSNVTDALEAAGAGYDLTTAAVGSGVANGTSVEGVGAGETVTLTAGNNIVTTQVGNEVQVALNSDLTGLNSVTATTANADTVNVTGGATLSASGIAMNGDGISGLANGAVAAGSTEAVTGDQLFSAQQTANSATDALGQSVAGQLGGAASYDLATDTVSGFSASVGGSSYANVTDAIEAGDAKADTGLQDVADALGGGATYDPDTGAISAPSYSVAGGTQTNVGAALSALDSANTTANAGLASAIGGGAGVAPDGTVTAPNVDVNGTAFSNLSDAIEAAGAGYTLTTGATGSGVANGSSAASIGAGETVTLTAGNNIVTTQNGNEVQVALNSNLTGLSSVTATTVNADTVNVTGGATLSATGIAMNGDRISGLAAGSTAAGSTEAVNGSQLNTLASSIATDLGGGASYDPVTGQLTAPGYAVDGTTYANVGDALAALAADSKFVDFNSTLAAADASGNNASAVGPNAQAAGNNAAAFGVNANAAGNDALATGQGANASGNGATALGAGASASGTNSVALGSGSQAGTANGGWTGTSFAGQTMTNAQNANAVVSVSGSGVNRQITGVADGAVNATSTDAVNGAQLFATAMALDDKASTLGDGLASAIGGGASVAPDGTVAAPSVDVNGTAFANLTDAIEAAGAGYDLTTAATGTGVANGSSVQGIGAGETVTLTAGNNIVTTQNGNEVQVALNSNLSGLNSVTATTLNADAVNVTGGATLSASGIAMNADKITGLANGTVAAGSTDAVTGDQLNNAQQAANSATDALGQSLADQLGGTAAYDPATDTVDGFSASVGGTSYANVTDAIEAGDAKADTGLQDVAGALGGGAVYDPDTGAISAPSYAVQGATADNVGDALANVDGALTNLTNGTSGLVQQVGGAPGSGLITIGAATGGTAISIAGTAGNRTISGVAAGATTASSTEAVNGSQINTLASSIAASTGGGSAYDPVTGTVTAPSVDVNGTSYANLTDAVEAAGAGHSLTTAATGSGVTNGSSAASIGAGETVTLTAGNNIVTTQNGNEVQIALNSNLTGLTSVSVNGGPTLSASGVAMNGGKVSGLAMGSTAAGSTEAVNGGQINTALASVASSLGGGSTYDPVTGTVSAPAYTIQGDSYADVGSALGAVDTNVTNLLNGTAGLVQQTGGSPGTGAITVGAGTGGTQISVAGTDGNRIVGGVAAGDLSVASSEAVNGSQLYALATALGAPVAPGGTVNAPTFIIEGNTYNNAGDAFDAVDSALSGGGIKYFRANSTMSDSTPLGMNSIAVGPVSGAGGDQSISMGLNTSAGGFNSIAIGTDSAASGDNSLSIGVGNQVTGDNSGAVGDPNIVTGSGSYAFGNDNTINADNAFALGNRITIDAGNNGAVALGNNSSVSAAATGVYSLTGGSIAATTASSVVSVGSVGAERQITHVAAGTLSATSTQAVNGSQLFSVAQAINRTGTALAGVIGGGMALAPDGSVTTPARACGGRGDLYQCRRCAGGG